MTAQPEQENVMSDPLTSRLQALIAQIDWVHDAGGTACHYPGSDEACDLDSHYHADRASVEAALLPGGRPQPLDELIASANAVLNELNRDGSWPCGICGEMSGHLLTSVCGRLAHRITMQSEAGGIGPPAPEDIAAYKRALSDIVCDVDERELWVASGLESDGLPAFWCRWCNVRRAAIKAGAVTHHGWCSFVTKIYPRLDVVADMSGHMLALQKEKKQLEAELAATRGSVPAPPAPEDPRLAEIRAREQAATKGPWNAHHVFNVHTVSTWAAPITDNAAKNVCGPLIQHEDAEFIAHAREDIPYLLNKLNEFAATRGSVPAPPTWQPIETLHDHERKVFFWLVPKTAEESYVDTSGNPIVTDHKPYRHEGKWGTWGALSKPTHWMPLPAPPVLPASSPTKEP